MASTGRHGVWTALDPALSENTRELTEALRARSEQAGRPSFRQLRARSARDDSAVVLTPTTLHRMFTPNPGRAGGNSLPEWTYYETLFRMLGADPDEYSARWEAAQQEWRSRTPTPDPGSAAEPAEPSSDARARRRGRRLRFLTPVSTAIALAVLVVGGSAIGVILARSPDGSPEVKTTEQQQQPHPDGSDPNATGCADTGRLTTFYSHLYPHWPVQTGPHSAAVVTLEYSPPCHTVWVVLRNATPGTTATLHRDGQHPAELSCGAGPDGSCSTAQLNDAGSRSYATASSGPYYARTRAI